MSFVELTPACTAEVIAFIRRHGDALAVKMSGMPDAETRLFKGRRIYGRRRAGKLTAVISVAERTHLTWQGWMYFPFVTAPRLTPEKRRRLLADFLGLWRAQASPHWRRMIIYDDTPSGDEAPFLTAEGFTFTRRHVKYRRDLSGGPPTIDEFPRVPEGRTKGYSVSIVKAAELEADRALADRILAVRNQAFTVRDNVDLWTPSEMMRQLNLPGATLMVLWHDGGPVGLCLWFMIEEGEDKGDAYVSEIAILRRHWGKVAADLLTFEMFQAVCAQGASTITGVADDTNRPSRNLMERFGLRVRSVSASWALEVPPSASA